MVWRPLAGVTALIGPGDSGKTTILDALGLLFSARWSHNFTDNDFFGGSPENGGIAIRATVVDPPKDLLRMEAFAGYTRGVNSLTGLIVDEPDDEDPALTVQLIVDRYLEPIWQVVADRQPEGAPLRASHRAAFGVVRIGSDSVTDLRWSKTSALVRMTGSDDHRPTAQTLVDASRAAKVATMGSFALLDAVATKVTSEARRLRAIPAATTLTAGLNSDSFQLGEGAVSLHDGTIPMERHGLGSRRLTGIAVQLADSADARVLLVDEVESGLEPYRVRHLLKALGNGIDAASPLAQVFMTTHSAVVLRELSHTQLGVVRRAPRETQVLRPEKPMQRMLRGNAEAFLAPSVLVCEGATEVGFSRGVFDASEAHDTRMCASVATADAGGENSLAEYAAAYLHLGYRVAIFCDFDTALDLSSVPDEVTIIRSDRGNCTEHQIISSLGAGALVSVIQQGIDMSSLDSVKAKLGNHGTSPSVSQQILAANPMTTPEYDLARTSLSNVAVEAKWFKSITGGELLAEIALSDTIFSAGSPAARLIHDLERWGAM